MTNTEFPFITRVGMDPRVLMTIMVADIKEFVEQVQAMLWTLNLLNAFPTVYLTLDVVRCVPLLHIPFVMDYEYMSSFCWTLFLL